MSDIAIDSWNVLELDSWWEHFTQMNLDTIGELREIAETELEEKWTDNLFDSDPLNANYTATNPEKGPLRSNQEENWSQWLAHLIRTGPGTFHQDLFEEKSAESPQRVLREHYLRNDQGKDRRVDIIVEYEKTAISIEVKKGDTDYRKTPETSNLTEREYRSDTAQDLNWNHYLLLPKSKESKLDEERYIDDEEGKLKEKWDSIEIIFWRRISEILRNSLLADEVVDLHWQSSALLFTTLIEQKICEFLNIPEIRHLPEEKSASFYDVYKYSGQDLSGQLEYFNDFLER